jgi:hypothetical protein
MEHPEAIRLMAAERYLLNELTPEQRQSFEEHFFECQECAVEVQAGDAFIQHSKKIFGEPVAPYAPREERESRPGWMAWLRPAFAVPVFAALIAVIAYQNMVSVPRLKQSASNLQPQVVASLYLTSGTLQGAEDRVIKVRSNSSFLLQVDIAADPRYSSYICELRSPSGDVVGTFPVSTEAARNTVPVLVPPQQKSGSYKLAVRGIVSGQQATSEISSSSFELQVQ